jgi:hypothetical protein
MNATRLDAITPTRRLNAKERKVFDRVVADFTHFQPSDAEQLTQLAEATVRYEAAAKETKRNPTVSLPVINRASGNIVGEKVVRNPAYATLKEAQTAMNSLARRLMIDAHSAEKRQRLMTKRVRAETPDQSSNRAGYDVANDPIMLEPDENFPGLCVPPFTKPPEEVLRLMYRKR